MAMDTRDAFLSQLWTLASFPLRPENLDDHKEEIGTFIEACVRPEDGTVNPEVTRSIIPKNYQKDLELFDDPVTEVPGDVEMDESLAVNEGNQSQLEYSDPVASNPQNMYVLPPKVPAPKPGLSLMEMSELIKEKSMLNYLVMRRKVTTTDAYKEAILEDKIMAVDDEIEKLKGNQLWSAMQKQRFTAPARLPTHWLNSYDEVKLVNDDRRLLFVTLYHLQC